MINHKFCAIAIREIAPLKYSGIGIFMGHIECDEDVRVFKNLTYNGSKFFIKDNCFFAVMVLDEDYSSQIEGDSTGVDLDCFLFARALFDEMKTKYTVGKEKASQRTRIGTGSDRRLMRIKNILHIAMKKEQKSYCKSLGKEIEWTHRWEVMGHWRRVATVGKDRFGNYGVKGFTWVVPHTKGAEDKNLIKKFVS